MWIEQLAIKDISPAMIKNKLSHARVFVRLAGGSLEGLNHIRVSRALEAVLRRRDYTSNQKDAIPAHTLRAALQAITPDINELMVRAAILLMFYGALRQSEVAPPGINRFDPLLHLTRADLRVGQDITVTIKAGKNLQWYNQRKTVTLYPTEDEITCPVRAVSRILSETPGLQPSAPLLVFADKHPPMPTSYLRSAWVRTMRIIGADPNMYSLHSLRKASATLAHSGGCSELEVQRHGGWSSGAYRTYIQTDSHRVTDILSQALQ